MTVKSKYDEPKAAAAEAPKDEKTEEPKAPKTPKAAAKLEDDNKTKVVKAYNRIDQAELRESGQLEGVLPSLDADGIRSLRVDADGTIFAVTGAGQKLAVRDGVCEILVGPGYMSPSFRQPEPDNG